MVLEDMEKISIMLYLLVLCHIERVNSLNKVQHEEACRPEDGLYKCSTNDKCLKRLSVLSKLCPGGDKIINNDNEFRCRGDTKFVARAVLNTADGCLGHGKERIILPCRTDEFTCEKSRLCIPRWAVLDSNFDCNMTVVKDTSDETGDALMHCERMEFRCRETGRCIPREWVLDGNNDCSSAGRSDGSGGSDEENPLSSCFVSDEFMCPSGRCLLRYRVKDGFPDCEDGSDEDSALSCYNQTEFRCRDSGRCIPRSWMLDGTNNCQDGSDEMKQDSIECVPGEFRCHNGRRCILNKYLCDGIDQCGDCSDEIEGCNEPRMWRCSEDRDTCIPHSYFCDTYNDCPRGSDNPNHLPGFKCMNKIGDERGYCLVPQWTLYDEHAICQDRSDVCFENGQFDCAYCVNNKTLISKKQICDGFIDCEDLSDECICNSTLRSTDDNGVSSLCRQVCYRGIKSLACDHCSVGQIFCQTIEKCVDGSAICDGLIDCPVSEIDEKFCSREKYPRNEEKNKTQHDFSCRKFPDKLVKLVKKIGLDTIMTTAVPATARKCDGVIECARFEDECFAGCPNEMEACEAFKLHHNMTLNLSLLGISPTFSMRACPGFRQLVHDYKMLIAGYSICNGVGECEGDIDEISCPGRIYCDGGTVIWPTGVKKIVSIKHDRKCDLIPDCVDSKDELECGNSTHFYCTGKKPLFVPKEVVMDGKQDCEDNSDECPPDAYEDDPFSSREQMISNTFLRYFVWITAAFAVFGNAGVILEASLTQAKSESSSMSKCNRILICNLALSDFIMGVALTMIGVKSSLLSGQYCSQEKQWRTSGQCSLVGAFVVTSSETSVFTLCILTFYRLYGTYRPLESRLLNIRKVYMATMLTWILSTGFAMVPLIPRINQSMVNDVLAAPSAFFRSTTISWVELEKFTLYLFSTGNRTLSLNDIGTWNNVVKKLDFYPDYSPKILAYFGYYSSHGVCIPRLFRTKNSPPLHVISLLIIALNFFSLLFIILCYCLIYHKSRAFGMGEVVGRSMVRDKRTQAMQRKITILIATDLCCWLPICIMAFLSQAGTEISEMSYAVTAIVILPINSSVNPIIYSNGFELLRRRICQTVRSVHPPQIQSIVERNTN